MEASEHTKYLRQMKYMPDVAPLTTILLILLTIFMVFDDYKHPPAGIKKPGAIYFQSEPLCYPVLSIYKDGKIAWERKSVDYIGQLPAFIMADLPKYNLKDKKILVQADSDMRFGRIQEVLGELKKAEIDIVGLIIDPWANRNY